MTESESKFVGFFVEGDEREDLEYMMQLFGFDEEELSRFALGLLRSEVDHILIGEEVGYYNGETKTVRLLDVGEFEEIRKRAKETGIDGT